MGTTGRTAGLPSGRSQITPEPAGACATWLAAGLGVPSSRRSLTAANAAQPICGDPRHRVVGVVDPLPPLISECEGEGLGDFVRSGRAEVGRIGHSGAIWKVARTSRGVPGCLVFSEAPITRTMPCPVTQWVIGAKSRAAAGIRQAGHGSGPGRAAAARQAGRALRDGCRDNPRTPHRAWCRFW